MLQASNFPSTTVQIESRRSVPGALLAISEKGTPRTSRMASALRRSSASGATKSSKNPSGWGSNPIFRDDLGQTSMNLNVKIPSWEAATCSTEHPKHSNDIILIYRWIMVNMYCILCSHSCQKWPLSLLFHQQHHPASNHRIAMTCHKKGQKSHPELKNSCFDLVT